ncbi:MAG: acylphosphatase [Candidatus Thermoplasmatota archaeon]
MKNVHVSISGRVQGVFFRATTKQKAEQLGINGWVRNTSDGRVEAVFEGKEEKVNQLLDWCHQGPSMANVENVEVEEKTPSGELTGFSIKR